MGTPFRRGEIHLGDLANWFASSHERLREEASCGVRANSFNRFRFFTSLWANPCDPFNIKKHSLARELERSAARERLVFYMDCDNAAG